MRHVLRARVEAVKALAGFFDNLQRAPQSTKVHASVHLAHLYGELIEGDKVSEVTGLAEMQGRRNVHEVIAFLRQRGAKIPTLKGGPIEGEWAALSSEAEGDGYTTVEDTEPVWVPSGDH